VISHAGWEVSDENSGSTESLTGNLAVDTGIICDYEWFCFFKFHLEDLFGVRFREHVVNEPSVL
jgi:hypothetical protein